MPQRSFDYTIVNAFVTREPETRSTSGNPAAVVLLPSVTASDDNAETESVRTGEDIRGLYPPDEVLQAVASRLGLPMTAFLVPLPRTRSNATDTATAATASRIPSTDRYALRWFNPASEVMLCGHALMALSSHLFSAASSSSFKEEQQEVPGPGRLTFQTIQYGAVTSLQVADPYTDANPNAGPTANAGADTRQKGAHGARGDGEEMMVGIEFPELREFEVLYMDDPAWGSGKAGGRGGKGGGGGGGGGDAKREQMGRGGVGVRAREVMDILNKAIVGPAWSAGVARDSDSTISILEHAGAGYAGVRCVMENKGMILVELPPEADLAGLKVDCEALAPFDPKYIILFQVAPPPAGSDASGTRYPHIHSRVFGSMKGFRVEDDATGSAHCAVLPYLLSPPFGTSHLLAIHRAESFARFDDPSRPTSSDQAAHAGAEPIVRLRQLSGRGGEMALCWRREVARVRIMGRCHRVSEGTVEV